MSKRTYIRSSGEWVEITTGSAVATYSTPPNTPTPVTGQMYFDAVANTLYVYNGSQWISAAGDEFLAYVYFD